MIFDRHANLKYKYGNRHFWARGYYVDTVGRNKKAIAEYIRNQLQEDISYIRTINLRFQAFYNTPLSSVNIGHILLTKLK